MLRSKPSRPEPVCHPPPAKRAKTGSSWEKGASGHESPPLCFTPPGWPDNTESRAGAETLQRIHSAERLFCSQTLSTPICPPKGVVASQRLDSQDEFTISYSQHYARPVSQGPSCTSEGAKAAVECECEAATQPLGPPDGGVLGINAAEAAGGGASGAAWGPPKPEISDCISTDSITPELAMLPATDGPQKLFPVFRRKAEWKTVHVIRHGESEYNAATRNQIDFADPLIYNPQLTAKGRAQSQRLKSQLAGMKLPQKVLWVTSPLSRAMQTMLLSCPKPDLLKGAQANPSSNAGYRTVVRSELSEHLMTTGDVGMPASFLRSKFPQLTGALEGLEERWWFSPCSNDAVLRCAGCYEPRRSLVERVGQFRRWVMEQPEKTIIVYGHSTMLREFIGGDKSLRNCELFTLQV
ncbi:hypothetical protein WJX73_004631 [Symbiochloris irregularis]|uniref:Phosphoglycerate mutase family protein n=1 Tax=Symbiochloris irregularis TaxID=706552 RepID=A0AAW1PBZ6_9CHLO